MSTIDFWQIIYDESQREHCYPFAKVYFNGDLTLFFENSVIAHLVPQSTADYVSVCSWRLKEKREQGWTPIINNNQELTLERIFSQDFDIAVLCPVDPQHLTMENSYHWHGAAWSDALEVFKKFMTIPTELYGHAIYQNHFIARREIYQSYVSECLAPALSFMADKEVFTRPSGYRNKKRDQKEIHETLARLNLIDWPIAPFLLERLFRIWIDGRNYKIINL